MSEPSTKEIWAVMYDSRGLSEALSFDRAIEEARDACINLRKEVTVVRITPYAVFTPKDPDLKVLP